MNKYKQGPAPDEQAAAVKETLRVPVAVILAHAVLVYLLWLLLFITKWFPYGTLAEVRDWLYRYF